MSQYDMTKTNLSEVDVSVSPLHVDIILGSANVEVDPADCVALHLSRARTISGVKRLKSSFRGTLNGWVPDNSVCPSVQTPL